MDNLKDMYKPIKNDIDNLSFEYKYKLMKKFKDIIFIILVEEIDNINDYTLCEQGSQIQEYINKYIDDEDMKNDLLNDHLYTKIYDKLYDIIKNTKDINIKNDDIEQILGAMYNLQEESISLRQYIFNTCIILPQNIQSQLLNELMTSIYNIIFDIVSKINIDYIIKYIKHIIHYINNSILSDELKEQLIVNIFNVYGFEYT